MAETLSDAALLRLAREGNVDALFQFAARDPHTAYFWLLVAQDSGHEDAADGLGDIEECYNAFKYDDDGLARMEVHRALGEAYLKGERGLEVNIEHGTEHLAEYLSIAQGSVDGGGVENLRALAASLDGELAAAVDSCIEGRPFRDVRNHVDRIQRLYDLMRGGTQIPTVIVESELDALLTGANAVVALVRERL